MNTPRQPADHPSLQPQPPSRALLTMFNWYIWWYLWLHFRGLRVANAKRLSAAPIPTIVFLNHASWWDPLVCIRIAQRLLPDHDHYAPMDAVAMRRYGFFRRLGLFPVELGSTRGATAFLRMAQAIVQRPGAWLWMTPQGRFTDVRQRPIRFMSGLGALAHRLPQCRLIPVAIEYAFWDERLPEILVHVGEPILSSDGPQKSSHEWTSILEQSMASTQEQLSQLVQTRNPDCFATFSLRDVGVGGIYQLWLRLQARAKGKVFHPEHRGIDRA